MLRYLKFYIIKNNEIIYHKIFNKDYDTESITETRNIMIRIINQKLNTFNNNFIMDDMLAKLNKTKHTSFKEFSHIYEIHLFELTPGIVDLDYKSLNEILVDTSISAITHIHVDDDHNISVVV